MMTQPPPPGREPIGDIGTFLADVVKLVLGVGLGIVLGFYLIENLVGHQLNQLLPTTTKSQSVCPSGYYYNLGAEDPSRPCYPR